MMARVLGIDPSLSSVGYCYSKVNKYVIGSIQPNKKSKSVNRLLFLRDEINKLLEVTQPDLIVYEDYSMGSIGKTFTIGELGGVVKLMFYEKEIKTMLVPPSCLKLYATGKGNANKELVLEKAIEVSKMSFSNNDESDAYFLYSMGVSVANNVVHRVASKKKALKGCYFL